MASTLPTQTTQWQLTHRAVTDADLTGPNPTFTLHTTPLPPLEPEKLLLRTLYLSNDPAQRAWIDATIPPERLYTTPVPLNTPMRARALCEVLAAGPSVPTTLTPGTHVLASTGWVTHAVVSAPECTPFAPLPPSLNLPETVWLGALGTTGLTAWHGLAVVAEAKAEDAVVVSGAAGATGSMVVQIAKKVLGCRRVVGIAGGAEKCRWVEQSCGADVCVDYKAEGFEEELRRETRGFVEVYFDNVGGEILDLMLTRMKPHGRIAACGAISSYNAAQSDSAGIKNWFEIISSRVQIRGFIVLDVVSEWGAYMNILRDAIIQGKIMLDEGSETVVDAKFEDVPATWTRLFEGGNVGKLLTRIV